MFSIRFFPFFHKHNFPVLLKIDSLKSEDSLYWHKENVWKAKRMFINTSHRRPHLVNQTSNSKAV